MKRIFLIVFIMSFYHVFSQEKIVKRYDNGNIQYEGFVVNNTLDSIYKEYYSNGVLKEEGVYKNCEYKTNYRKIVRSSSCGGPAKLDSILIGIKNGTWKDYYENGKIKSETNYFCGIKQGNFYKYSESGVVESIFFGTYPFNGIFFLIYYICFFDFSIYLMELNLTT